MFRFLHFIHPLDREEVYKTFNPNSINIDVRDINFDTGQNYRILLKMIDSEQLQKIFATFFLQSQLLCEQEPSYFSLIFQSDFLQNLVWMGKRIIKQNNIELIKQFTKDLFTYFIETLLQLNEIQNLNEDIHMDIDTLEIWNQFYKLIKYIVPENIHHDIVSKRINNHESELFNIGYHYTIILGIILKLNQDQTQLYMSLHELTQAITKLLSNINQRIIIPIGFIPIVYNEVLNFLLKDLRKQTNSQLLKLQLDLIEKIFNILLHRQLEIIICQGMNAVYSFIIPLCQIIEFYLLNIQRSKIQNILSNMKKLFSRILIKSLGSDQKDLLCLQEMQRNNILIRILKILEQEDDESFYKIIQKSNLTTIYQFFIEYSRIQNISTLFLKFSKNQNYKELSELTISVDTFQKLSELEINQNWIDDISGHLIKEGFQDMSQVLVEKVKKHNDFINNQIKQCQGNYKLIILQISYTIQMCSYIDKVQEIIYQDLMILWNNPLQFIQAMETLLHIILEGILRIASMNYIFEAFNQLLRQNKNLTCSFSSQNQKQQIYALGLLRIIFLYPHILLYDKFRTEKQLLMQTANCLWCGKYLAKGGYFKKYREEQINPRCGYCNEVIIQYKIYLQQGRFQNLTCYDQIQLLQCSQQIIELIDEVNELFYTPPGCEMSIKKIFSQTVKQNYKLIIK